MSFVSETNYGIAGINFENSDLIEQQNKLYKLLFNLKV